jgi:PilZ domain
MSPTASPSDTDRRHHVRVTFSPVRRPRLQLADGVHEVLDASLGGLRVRHADPFRPALGTRVDGKLHWTDADNPLPIRGTIVRVQLTEFALACDDGILPIAHILSESARRRDSQPEIT